MMLGEQECDYWLAYFLKNGEYPKEKYCCQRGSTDDDIEYYIHNKKPDEFICWQGTQIPRWLL